MMGKAIVASGLMIGSGLWGIAWYLKEFIDAYKVRTRSMAGFGVSREEVS